MYNIMYICHIFTFFLCHYLSYHKIKIDLLKMCATFWGGVEVACMLLRKVNRYFRK